MRRHLRGPAASIASLLVFTVTAPAKSQHTVRYVITYDSVVHGRRTQVSGTDKGCVSVTGWDLAVTSINVAEPSHEFWAWAHRADSVSRLPASRRAHEELDFEPVMFGSDNQVAYHRVVSEQRPEEHYVAFVTTYKYLFGTWMDAGALSRFLQAIVRAAKITDSLSGQENAHACALY